MMRQALMPKSLRARVGYSLLLGIVLSVALNVGLGGRVHAWNTAPTANFPPMPAEVRDYLANCGYTNNQNAQTAWLSPPGDSSTTADISVDYGQPSVPVQYNVAGVVCTPRDANLLSTNTKVVSTSPYVAELDGKELGYSYGVNEGDVSISSLTFNYYPTGGFTSGGTYTINAEDKKINHFSSSGYVCVSNGTPEAAANNSDFGACNSRGGAVLRMNVTIKDRPAAGNVGSWGCDLGDFTYAHRNNNTYTVRAGILGYLQDPNYDWTQVHVYIDNVNPANLGQQVFVGSYDASQYPISLNGVPIGVGEKPPYGTGVPNWHDWFVVPKADLDRFGDVYQHNVFVYGIGRNADGSTNGNNPEIFHQPGGQRASLTGCVQPVCSVTINPGSPEVGVSYTSQLNYTYSPGSQGRAIAPVGIMNLNGVQTFNFPSSRSDASHTFGPYIQAGPGTLQARGRITQAEFSIGCTSDFDIVSKPYLKVFGNDIAAGGKFADNGPTACTAGPKTASGQPPASIWVFNKKVTATGTYYGGSSGQFGAFALGQIVRFNTAGDRNGRPAPTTPNDLSFGNMIKSGSTPTAASEYDTGNSGIYRCIPDYFSASTKLPAPNASLTNGNPLITTTGNPKSIANGIQEVKFVDGNAFIQDNIKYQNTTWANTSQIPSYYLIVKGDIYIDSNVTQLDGVYIAQPRADGTGGTIYTCTNGGRNNPWLYSKEAIFDNCQKNLTITGSFIANNIKFQRARGTVQNSIPNPAAAANQITMNYSSAGNPAIGSCMALLEAGSPSWDDNFLCSNRSDLYWTYLPGVSPSPGYQHAGDSCFSWAAQHNNNGFWLDNRICWPAASPNPQFSWSTTNDPAKTCTLIHEIADANPTTGWKANSWLCVPTVAPPAYTPVNEEPVYAANGLIGNIAETFNFSQELYLAPTPSILDTVIGGGTSSNVYQSITSLPPVL